MNQETPKPNFDFIVNQPGPELNKPKRSKKPLIIMGVAVFILLGLVAFAAIFGKKATNVQQANTATSAQEQIVQQYLNDLKEQKYPEAFKLTKIDGLDERMFTTLIAPIIVKTTELDQCTFKKDAKPSTTSKLIYCPYKQGGGVLYEYVIETQQNQSYIVKINTLRQDKAS